LLQPIKILYKNDITQIKEVPKLFDAVYSSINNFIKQQGLITGKMMAFYLSYQNSIFLETASEFDKNTLTNTGKYKIKNNSRRASCGCTVQRLL